MTDVKKSEILHIWHVCDVENVAIYAKFIHFIAIYAVLLIYLLFTLFCREIYFATNKMWQATDEKGDKMPATVGHRHRPLFHRGGMTSSQPNLDIFGQFDAKTVHEELIHG